MNLKEQLEVRRNYLQQVKGEKEKALETAPQGSLRVLEKGENVQYYQRNALNDDKLIYIKKRDVLHAQALAQKDYDEKILRSVDKELMAIKHYLKHYPEINAEQIYENLHKGRQCLVHPIRVPDHIYINQWESRSYSTKVFSVDVPEYYSIKGERVRSKSEVIIADMLYRMGIPYHYEYPLYLKGMGEIYPDFTVLNVRVRKEMYWEHFGMMDDSLYAEKAIRKVLVYNQNDFYFGEKVIFTYETKNCPINQKQIEKLIYKYLL